MSANEAKQNSAKKGDPLDIVPRLYRQLDGLLNDMESAERNDLMTMPQRISGMIALGRIMKMLQDIRRGEFDARAGSAVDKYTAAFKTPHATGGRGANPRPAYPVQSHSDADEDDFADDFAT